MFFSEHLASAVVLLENQVVFAGETSILPESLTIVEMSCSLKNLR
jgi:hypothetical protein